ncbi:MULTISPECIES: 2-amino-4-hydroxy-6-hydroxymethyldihydropteridine diphosphokinase [Salinicola]|uniref:2-amino-4-hydroxy-6-hydroxymethyldihydropteridine diphosphokinase n=1 Tax=Salinicola socius TaxID=404433 RepID=A0A1Q8SN86_9GAMM|nr:MULTISPECIES: 2-amino-4-hydroxy-6-hydroxymethyldihydropteridine diphosphokinase [Salinicola]OLO02846.1 2-amino-4-hydroxy-6-hydroxymethyldihydropteridine diphosphokinase [Salinicola socius]
MPLVVLGLGSNIRRHYHLTRALDALATLAGPAPLQLSRVFESQAVGFDDDRPFYNLVAAFETERAAAAIGDDCKAIERDNGRPAGPTKLIARTLDIDVLLWGDAVGHYGDTRLPREDILRYAFVLHPLAELLPSHRHPLDGRTFAALWAAFDAADQPHHAVDFPWGDRLVSRAGAPEDRTGTMKPV